MTASTGWLGSALGETETLANRLCVEKMYRMKSKHPVSAIEGYTTLLQ